MSILMTQHVSFILRLIVGLNLVRKMAGGDINTHISKREHPSVEAIRFKVNCYLQEYKPSNVTHMKKRSFILVEWLVSEWGKIVRYKSGIDISPVLNQSK